MGPVLGEARPQGDVGKGVRKRGDLPGVGSECGWGKLGAALTNSDLVKSRNCIIILYVE